MPEPLPLDAITKFGFSRRQFLSRVAAGSAGFWAATAFPLRTSFGYEAGSEDSFIIRQENPLNGEPALGPLVKEFVTPTELFYIRNHGNIPKIDVNTFKLKIEGLVEQPTEFSLAELKERFPKAEGMATMTCAGNRRQEHGGFKKVGGVQWDAGAIGNATWGGVRLKDVIEYCKPKEGAAHLWFDGQDDVEVKGKTINFGGSIPLAKGMQDLDDALASLIAWEMNGEALTPEHGYPLRTVIPGYIGARSVKWLGRIVVSDRPSPNHYVATAYKVVTEDTPLALQEVAPIYRYPLNIAACTSSTSEDRDQITVQGYVLPSGRSDTKVKEVEVSVNGGRRWERAKLIDEQRPYCWTRWEAELPLRRRNERVIVRAIDTVGEVTPDRVDWNAHGYLYNGWHSLPIEKQE